MRKKVILILLIAWVAAVAVGIFMFSSQTGEESGEISNGLMDSMFAFLHSEENRETLHYLIRKSAHVMEYALLGASIFVLLFYLVDIKLWKNVSRLKMAGFSLAYSVIFAVTDEIHQAFVPGRGSAAMDVLLDAVGAALGIALIYAVYRYKRPDK